MPKGNFESEAFAARKLRVGDINGDSERNLLNNIKMQRYSKLSKALLKKGWELGAV